MAKNCAILTCCVYTLSQLSLEFDWLSDSSLLSTFLATSSEQPWRKNLQKIKDLRMMAASQSQSASSLFNQSFLSTISSLFPFIMPTNSLGRPRKKWPQSELKSLKKLKLQSCISPSTKLVKIWKNSKRPGSRPCSSALNMLSSCIVIVEWWELGRF